ncbi:hypothetical protein CHELA1G11_10231 [Hyphomicrobiales bacterium]|nr:hypothetical protein CHELA1G11_10231 [Hyphomicrobiales bacterium]CAH1676138.1 hypothetical protein CHELA1G2_14076 [Hyphomicrobiales bacterium]
MSAGGSALFGCDERDLFWQTDLATRGLMPGCRLVMIMVMLVMRGAWTNRATNGARSGTGVRQDAADGHEAPAAIRTAAEAAISLRGAARLRRVLVCQCAADISIGHDVAVADDHYRSSLEQFKKTFDIKNLLDAIKNSRPSPATESTHARTIGAKVVLRSADLHIPADALCRMRQMAGRL